MCHTAIVIDESDVQRHFTERILKNSSFAEEIMSFDSAFDAIVFLGTIEDQSDKLPDVIFLDIHLPFMDGFDFLDAFLELPVDIKEHCKIVTLSSPDVFEDDARVKEYPIIRKFLSKPLSYEMLKEVTAA